MTCCENGKADNRLPRKVTTSPDISATTSFYHFTLFFSFSITPVKEVNFGAIAVSSQKTEQVVIENCGQHEFRFSCVRMEKMMELVKLKQQIVSKIKSTEMPLLTIPQPRLQAGLFTISPASGSIPPGGTQTINIDCSAESQGISQEEIAIEISDRNATLYPYGVPFTLKAEAHMPSIETDDITTIFEEHRICHDLSMLDSLEPTEGDFHGGVYAVAENRFIFPSILVGTAARARFCMANRGKVPADVTFEIRPIGHLPPRVTRRPASRGNRPASSTEMFSLEMERTQIDPYTSTYVTVTFTPQAMQKYVSNFLVYLENPSSSTVQPTSVRGATVAGPKQPTTGVPVLNFELIGQGHLPSLTVVEPGVRGRQGQIICAFKRVHVGRQVKRRLLLRNSGALNCGVNLTLVDEDHVFYLEPEKENDALLFIDPDSLLPGCSSEVEYSCLPSAAIQMYTASILIRPGREYTLNLYYRPIEPGLKSIGQLKLLVVNNPYEDTSVELIGNALADEVCIQDLPQLDPLRAEYIHEALRRRTPEIGSVETVSSLDKSWDDIQILRDLQHNHLDFGDCAVSEELSHTFTMTHCGPVSDQETATSFRFCWPTDHRNLQFIPTKGHLHPKQSRRITVKFRPNSRPVTLQTIPINCTLKRIRVPIPEGCTKASFRTMPQEHPVSEYGTTTEVARRKRKVVETEPEPTFSEIPEVPDPQPLTLLVSAVADFARFSCSAESVSFQNTLMFQRRTHRFELSNIGVVDLHFSWLVEMLTSMPSSNESEVPTPLLDSEETKVKCWDVSLVPFSVQPLHGMVPPGRSISVEVAFSPLVAGTFAARLRGMFENLIPSEAHGENTGPMVQLEGIAEQPFIHFDLCESNYLVGDRRNPDRPGPAGQPLGGPLDPATRVIELWTIGVGTTVSKCFSVANLTSENLDFEIQNQDGWTANDYKPVICTTSHGQITSGRSTELQFTFTPSTLGITESFWRLYIEQLQFAVPLLVVGHTREPQVTWDRSHLNLKSVLVGHTISRDVYLVNHESASDGIHEPLQFKFLDSSRYGPGRQDWIMVQPMSGHVNPGDRVPVKISFTAKAERSINIKLLCKVKYCERPLAVNVKAEGYSMSISVFVESANEQKSTVELQPLWTPCLGLDIDQIVLEVNNTIQSNFGKYHRKFGRLDFGELDPGEVVTRRVTVLNCGKFGCDYAWMCSVNEGNIMNNAQLELAHSFLSAEPDQSRGPIVKVAPVSGNLQPGENVVCTFTFSPPKQLSKCLNQKLALDGLISACLAIREGPAYGLQLTGRTSGRLLEFSTSVIDFGSQLVSRPGLEPAVRCLTLSNIHPSRSISVECLTPNSDVFQYSMRPTVLQPKAVESQDGKTNSANVWFTFTPKACKQYEEKFTFEVNGSTLYTIRLLGTGIKLRIQPVIGPLLILTSKPNGQQRCIKCADTKPDEMSTVVDLGSLRKNQQARRCVTLINKSAAPIAIYRVKVESIVFEESRTAKSKSNQGGEISSASCSLLSKELQIRLCNPVSEDYQLGLAPISTVPLPIVLEPKVGTTMVEVTFESTVRIPRFTAEVLCELGSVDSEKRSCLPATQTTLHHLPVFRVQGYCEVHDIRFDIQSVNFGPVVCGGQLSKRLVLINSGDLGAKFRWVDKTIGTGLDIAPMEGFIAPNTEVPFSLTLRPTKLAPEIRFEDVTCDIDGVGPMKLTVTGACIPPKLIKGPIQFATAVRQQDTQTVKIVNPTNYLWKLRPVIDGPCWSGEQILDIKPQETGVYKLVYKPMTMTREERKHKGTVFFPLPDGTGLLYHLVGSADTPKPMFQRSCEVECRKPHVECINVANWLNCTQRFQVQLSVIRPDKLDPGTSLNGVEYIEVPADGNKEYKLHFMGYRECTTVVRATFTNESSGEYQFCELTFKTVKSKVVEVIRMRTRIRKAAKHTFQLHNPLNVPVTFNLITNVPEVQYPSQLQVPAKCTVDATLEYLPLFVGTKQGRVEASCNELSTVAYALDLEAAPTPKEPAVQFDASIGQRHTQTVRFMNYAKVKTEFTVSPIDNAQLILFTQFAKTYDFVTASFGNTHVRRHLPEVDCYCRVESPTGTIYVGEWKNSERTKNVLSRPETVSGLVILSRQDYAGKPCADSESFASVSGEKNKSEYTECRITDRSGTMECEMAGDCLNRLVKNHLRNFSELVDKVKGTKDKKVTLVRCLVSRTRKVCSIGTLQETDFLRIILRYNGSAERFVRSIEDRRILQHLP
ncbi:hydrocephalus-inducing protein homolog [Clonorchis sinensis]|uniref:Hydrocephalus-inducing protein homolog n=1 Tax=Clonorchis sinensis TaxID=79923 RepID=G7YWV4_CLOSI|nr:hydrocephalus-inducing protein homolog [Clonorchis sinensis]